MTEMSEISDLVVKWSGAEYSIKGLLATDNVFELKNSICKATGVLPERQKLFGLKLNGKPPNDDAALGSLSLKPGTKIMMMGTREEVLENIKEPDSAQSDIINDFDIEEDEIAIPNREEYLAKIDKRIKSYTFKTLNEPRPGKKLLVLDVDYTLFDHRSMAESGSELMRPYLHEFLTSAYVNFDIIIWSATSMKWIDAKMEELGMLSNPSFKISMVMDDLAMITVDTPVYGVIEVKPLGVIWGRFPQWNNTNSIMFDDMRRNFIMNPQSGLKIRAFRNAHSNRATDRELLRLADYLKDISDLDDFSGLNHRHWEKYKKRTHKRPKTTEHSERD